MTTYRPKKQYIIKAAQSMTRLTQLLSVHTIVPLLVCCMALVPATQALARQYTLVIDAGHGGKDAGALGKTAKEKNINLNVALAFGKYVEQNCKDVRVIYTRKTDVFIPLHERADIANRNKADVFISIHTNAVVGSRSISGLETYTMGMRRSDEKLSAAMRENEVVTYEKDYKQHYSGFDPRQPESYIIFDMINDANMLQSVELAKSIQKHVCRTAGRVNKGVKQDAFLVLRETSMPACLIELGFITTPADEAYLTSKNGVDALARGIYMAFVEYKAKSTGGVVPPPPHSQAAEEEQKKQNDSDSTKEESRTVTTEAQQPNEQLLPKQEVEQAPVKDETADDKPVFKVQFMASDRKLSLTDKKLKGVKNVDCYKDGGMWKYTVGSSTNYNEINALKREMAKQFPQAFVVAFKNGNRIDIQTAIQEFRSSKKK